MKKLLIGGLVATALVLTGCTTAEPAPAVTVTETAKPAPSTNNGSSSSMSVRDEFVMYMGVAGIPNYMVSGEALDILVDHAQDVCGYIADGDSQEDILWILTIAAESSNSSDDIVEAFVAASVAATYTYCPQYQGFWD